MASNVSLRSIASRRKMMRQTHDTYLPQSPFHAPNRSTLADLSREQERPVFEGNLCGEGPSDLRQFATASQSVPLVFRDLLYPNTRKVRPFRHIRHDDLVAR